MANLILIVEDDSKSMELTRDFLQVKGYQTIEAIDGKQGVQLAKAKKPDLILMDIMMPVMDGYAACSAIKKDDATKNIPVIMLTSVGFALNEKLARLTGASGYITKPVDLQHLLETINQFLQSQ